MPKLPAVFLVILATLPAEAAFVVRPSDLRNPPVPPNPVRLHGIVVSTDPLTVSDGRSEIVVSDGAQGELGKLLVLEGDWDGTTFTPTDIIYPNDMVYVPSGAFLMGNSGLGDDAVYGLVDERPQHLVYLGDYWIGRSEVTRSEYRLFIDSGGYDNPDLWSPEGWEWKTSRNRKQPAYWYEQQDWGTGVFEQTGDFPVVGVSYYEAEAYCTWAGGRLPTEAEWEKSARWADPHPRVYPWGDTWDNELCNTLLDNNPLCGLAGMRQTGPAGSYEQGVSYTGRYDMAGNAAEWVGSWYKSYPGASYQFDDTGVYRVVRGGSFLSNLPRKSCRAAYRDFSAPSAYSQSIGFRIAR